MKFFKKKYDTLIESQKKWKENIMKKNILVIAGVIILSMGLMACSSSNDKESPTGPTEVELLKSLDKFKTQV